MCCCLLKRMAAFLRLHHFQKAIALKRTLQIRSAQRFLRLVVLVDSVELHGSYGWIMDELALLEGVLQFGGVIVVLADVHSNL